jgi:hypothetical protein
MPHPVGIGSRKPPEVSCSKGCDPLELESQESGGFDAYGGYVPLSMEFRCRGCDFLAAWSQETNRLLVLFPGIGIE